MDFPAEGFPPPSVLLPYSFESIGVARGATGLAGATSVSWSANNLAYYYPFSLTSWATAYQLLFWVGATSSGNIDIGIYTTQKNRLVSAGTTAMSVTVNTIQLINITDTVLAPGAYLLGVACSTTGGTVFAGTQADEASLSTNPIYEQATALPLPDPCVPVVSTQASPLCVVAGIVFVPTF